MLPPVPSPKIAPVDEGYPLQKPGNIPEEQLIPPTPEFIIDENMQHVISVLTKQQYKDKKPISEFTSSNPFTKKSKGWSQAQITQALEERILIQALKDNPNMMLGLSPLCRDRIIHDLDIVPFMYYNLPTHDLDQLDLSISPYDKFYINFGPLHQKMILKWSLEL